MKLAIHQPNFLPWIGYFHKIAHVDRFVFFDDVQLPRGKSFCLRTKILINGQESWLGIPALGKSDMLRIKDVRVCNTGNWKHKHLKTLELNYCRARWFGEVFPLLESVYGIDSDYLVDFNIPFIIGISNYLQLGCAFARSSEVLSTREEKGIERLIEINTHFDADTYVSGTGKGSQRYIESEKFAQCNIALEWLEFFPFDYPQGCGTNFVGGLSIIDLLFNCGKESVRLLQRQSVAICKED